MIACQAQVLVLAQQRYALIWVRSVPHHVSQAPDGVKRARIVNHRLESDQVCVDVRKD
jgi:hypothetical protein